MNFKTAIFDMDETLVEIPSFFELDWTQKCFESFCNKNFSKEKIKEYLKLSIPKRELYLTNVLGFDSADHYLSMWLTPEALAARFACLTVYKDTEALSELKKKGLQLGLVTAAPENLGEMQKIKLEEVLGISNLFDSVVYIHKSQFPKKPHPSALNYCIDELSAERESTFYCGNLDKDIQMANNAKITPILIDRYNGTNFNSTPITINSLLDTLKL